MLSFNANGNEDLAHSCPFLPVLLRAYLSLILSPGSPRQQRDTSTRQELDDAWHSFPSTSKVQPISQHSYLSFNLHSPQLLALFHLFKVAVLANTFVVTGNPRSRVILLVAAAPLSVAITLGNSPVCRKVNPIAHSLCNVVHPGRSKASSPVQTGSPGGTY